MGLTPNGWNKEQELTKKKRKKRVALTKYPSPGLDVALDGWMDVCYEKYGNETRGSCVCPGGRYSKGIPYFFYSLTFLLLLLLITHFIYYTHSLFTIAEHFPVEGNGDIGWDIASSTILFLYLDFAVRTCK